MMPKEMVVKLPSAEAMAAGNILRSHTRNCSSFPG
jgi:hypothetical protein